MNSQCTQFFERKISRRTVYKRELSEYNDIMINYINIQDDSRVVIEEIANPNAVRIFHFHVGELGRYTNSDSLGIDGPVEWAVIASGRLD